MWQLRCHPRGNLSDALREASLCYPHGRIRVTGSVQFVYPLGIGGHRKLAPDWLGSYESIYVLTEVENLNGASSQVDKSLVKNNYPKKDFHEMYVGEILKVLTKEGEAV